MTQTPPQPPQSPPPPQQPPQQPQYGAPAGVKPHRGTLILVFGILGFVVCVIFEIVAWVMGNNDLREMDAGRMDPAGRDTTKAGKICGMISTILGIAAVVIWLIAMLVLGGRAMSM